MLRQGFDEDIERIFQYIHKQLEQKTQNLLFSATIPTWVLEIARKYLDAGTFGRYRRPLVYRSHQELGNQDVQDRRAPRYQLSLPLAQLGDF